MITPANKEVAPKPRHDAGKTARRTSLAIWTGSLPKAVQKGTRRTLPFRVGLCRGICDDTSSTSRSWRDLISFGYGRQSFVRRNRVAVALATAAFLPPTAGWSGSSSEPEMCALIRFSLTDQLMRINEHDDFSTSCCRTRRRRESRSPSTICLVAQQKSLRSRKHRRRRSSYWIG